MCGHMMIDIQACHDLCPDCGALPDSLRRPIGNPRTCAARRGDAIRRRGTEEFRRLPVGACMPKGCR